MSSFRVQTRRPAADLSRSTMSIDKARAKGLFVLCLLVLGTGVLGCFDPRVDNRVRSQKGSYVWAAPGQRRLAQFMVPGVLTLERDRFRTVSSNGGFVAAIGAQHAEARPNDHYLYVVDGRTGRILSNTPVRMYVSGNVRMCEDRVVLVGYYFTYDPDTLVNRITVVGIPDGHTVFAHDTSEMQVDFADVLDDIVRVRMRNNANITTDVYYELSSGQRISTDEINTRLEFLVAQGRLDDAEKWKSQELDSDVRSEAMCGDLLIRCEEGWLVATRRAVPTTQTSLGRNP